MKHIYVVYPPKHIFWYIYDVIVFSRICMFVKIVAKIANNNYYPYFISDSSSFPTCHFMNFRSRKKNKERHCHNWDTNICRVYSFYRTLFVGRWMSVRHLFSLEAECICVYLTISWLDKSSCTFIHKPPVICQEITLMS